MAQPQTLLDAFEQAVAKNPTAPAVFDEAGPLSFGELAAKAQATALALKDLTSQPTLALFLPMIKGFPIAFFGGCYANKTVLPLNMLVSPEILMHVLKDAGVDTILTIALFKRTLEKLPGMTIVTLEDLKAQGEAAAAAGRLPSPEQVQQALKPLRPKPESLAVLLYTSGTTGMPKGVELTHQNLVSNALDSIAMMGICPETRVMGCLPTFHSFALTATMNAPLLAGGSFYAFPKFDPQGVLKATVEAHVNTYMMVPSMYRVLTKAQQRAQLPIKLKLAVAGAEPLPDEVRLGFEETFGVPLLQGFGQTETSPVVSFNTPGAHRPGTIGKPIPHVEVAIRDVESGEALSAGAIGEIWVKGPNVMRGYHNKPEETEKVLRSDGWLRTGDMGKVDEDGYITITGRHREMIKVAGEMVFPAEVENALLTHPAVFEAGVRGEKDPKKGEIVLAFVTLQEGKQATEDELLAHCRSNLAPYKVPKSVQIRTELPKNPTGKIMRRLLE